jgi:mono/diheme cytochrome c family protein
MAAVVAGAPAISAAQEGIDLALLQKGAELYSDFCSACHQPGGVGTPPNYPALAGNAKLQDLGLIVGNVHNGFKGMPAFPDLTAEEVSAIATYVRNSWGNGFGAATTEEVATIIANLGEPAAAGASGSIWDGVYTQEQADRGTAVYSGVCAKCHGNKMNGAGWPDQPSSPAIARAGFLQRWEGRTLEALFDYVRTKMPLDNPGQLDDQKNIDIVASMLALSGAPAGDAELPPDLAALGGIVMTEKAQ